MFERYIVALKNAKKAKIVGSESIDQILSSIAAGTAAIEEVKYKVVNLHLIAIAATGADLFGVVHLGGKQ